MAENREGTPSKFKQLILFPRIYFIISLARAKHAANLYPETKYNKSERFLSKIQT